jgi:hypothetical protein
MSRLWRDQGESQQAANYLLRYIHRRVDRRDLKEAKALAEPCVLGRAVSDFRSWQILLQNTLAFLPNDDSVALMRFAVEAIDDGAAQSRPRRVFLFISS